MAPDRDFSAQKYMGEITRARFVDRISSSEKWEIMLGDKRGGDPEGRIFSSGVVDIKVGAQEFCAWFDDV